MIQNVYYRVLIAIGASFLLLAGCQNTNLPVDSGNFFVDPATVCSGNPGPLEPCFGVMANWRVTVDNLLEVSATDFTNGDFVGTQCEGEDNWVKEWQFLYFNSWRPVDGFKHNMSGVLHEFNWSIPGDEDWNLLVVPNPPFSFLISDVEALHHESADWHKECGDLSCLEVEISPDKQFWTNPWFFQPGVNSADTAGNGFSSLEGGQMGFYGLWVMDANHDFKSEIHPVDMMWFKDHFESFDVFWLLFLQDNTARFDDQDNFDCGGIFGDNIPAGFRPWTQSPRSGQFNIAFEVDPKTEVVNFSIEELRSRFVVTAQDASASQDADDGTLHGLQYNGKVVVRVREDQSHDEDLGVTFTNLSLTPDGKLRGFVSIRSKIGGDDDKDEEGFHILYVIRSQNSDSPQVALPPTVLSQLLITSKEVEGSLKNNGSYFTGDIRLKLDGSDSTKSDDYTISKIQFVGRGVRQDMKFKQDMQTKEILIQNLPLVPNGRLILISASGLTSTLRTLSLGLAPSIDEAVTNSVADAEAGKVLSASVGGIPGASLPKNTTLANLQEFQLRLYPLYGPYDENNEESPLLTDVQSPFAKQLNQAIIGQGQTDLEALLGSAQPFTIKWTFAATNLSTGRPVPVYTDGKSRSEGIQIEFLSSRFHNDSVNIKFLSPGSAGIIECRVQVSITDAGGKTSIVTHRLWSHGFPSGINTVDKLATLIQALTGLKDKSLLIAPSVEKKLQEISLSQDAKTRHKEIVDAYLIRALKDKQITIEELGNIIGALKEFSIS